VLPAVALLAGLLFGTSASLAGGEDSPERPDDLAGLIRERNGEVTQLTERAEGLQDQVETLAAERSPVDDARDTAEAMAPLVGAGPVSGPAVRVVLDDAGYTLETLPEGYTVDDVVVHQQDVHGVINALWTGGAEALMVQDQRIVATSSVQCVGNTLYLQGRVYSPPYTITAIGDVAGLQQALLGDPVVTNYRAWSDLLGLGYQVETFDAIEMPAYSGSVRPEHVTVIEPRTPSTSTDGTGER
jgi:uncharacterized protein YlxW (UPF0749 family)